MSEFLIPGAKTVIQDSSQIRTGAEFTKIGIQVRATRGRVNVPKAVGTYAEAIKSFGSFDPAEDRAIKRLLATGNIVLIVSRACHFDDLTDKTSAGGVLAGGNFTVGATAETRAKGTVNVTGAGAGTQAGTITLKVFRTEGPAFEFPSVPIGADQTPAQIETAIVTALNGQLGFGFAIASNKVEITVPAGSGTDANSWIISATKTGLTGGTAVAFEYEQFTGGTNGVLAGNLTARAKGPGTGYNGLTVTISKAASKTPGKVDFKISQAGVTLEERRDLDQTITPVDLAQLSNSLEFCDLFLNSGALPIGSFVLSSGEFDNSTVVASDLAGSLEGQTGWYAFGAVASLDYLANLEFPDRVVDLELQNYCSTRPSVRFFIRTPLALTPQGYLDYRNGTGAYTGAPFDSFAGDLVIGYFREKDKVTGAIREVSPIVDVLICRAKTDAKAGKWESHAGFGDGNSPTAGFGQIQNPEYFDCPQNFYDQSLGAILRTLYQSGCGIVIDHPSFGLTVWYQRNLYKNQNSLLRNVKVAQLCAYLAAEMTAIMEKGTFRAADPIIWRKLYRDAKLVINELETGKNGYPPAIEPGENVNWRWLGDQNVASKSEAVYNAQGDLDQGRYTAKFAFKPIGSMEELTMVLSVFDSNSYKIAFE